jgi:cytidylate kinase
MIIAIDGPAGSGKSTIAREVAKRLGMRYLDTGAMYRAVTLAALEDGLLPDRVAESGALAAGIDLRFEERPDDLTRVFIGDREVTDEIRGRLVSQNVSTVSAEAAVRKVLTERQRAEATKGSVVLEGRDMGTVVVPRAEVKVFLTASIEERARRRQAQLRAQGTDQPLEQLIEDIRTRDAYDSGRQLAPLRKADDATEIDTTGMTIEEVIQAVCGLAAQADAPRKRLLSRVSRGPLDTWFYRFAHSFIPILFRLLWRMKIQGLEYLPASGPVVIACNHRSNLDPFFLGSACPRQIHFMAKAELWAFKPLGWLVAKLGTFPVHRGKADREAVRRAVEVLDGGAVLGLFPEGRRQRETELGDIRPGVSLFSLRDGVVTIPVVLRGTDRVVRNHLLRFPRVTATFGPPVRLPGQDIARASRAALTSEELIQSFRRLLRATAPATEGDE